jgi:hypothetical protein
MPWSGLQASILATCAASEREPEASFSYLTSNGNLALACALRYAGGDLAAGDKAATVLEHLPEGVDIPIEDIAEADLRVGQGVLQGVRAWDLLLGVGYPKGHDPVLAMGRLHALGDSLWERYMVDLWVFPASWMNNHNLKLAATLGLLGMGANDDPRAARYVNWAAAEIPRVAEQLFAADGGYAEGPHYLGYALESLMPWFGAFRRFLGGDAMLVRSVCAHDLDPDCEESLRWVTDPLDDPRFCDSGERLVETLMPSGWAPNTDDANLSSAVLGVLASLCASPTLAWGWSFQPGFPTGGSVNLAGDLLLAWDLAPDASEPPLGPIARPDAGFAVLRSDWGANASYALLLAESGVARSGGGGHEHPDALSFLWAEEGSYPLIDSGYGSWSLHGEVNDAEAHNLILVDGEGPGDADAELLGAGLLGPFQVGRAAVTFGGVSWTRALALGENLLVVWDHLEAVDGRSHDLALQLQGNSTLCEATSSSTSSSVVFSWDPGGMELLVASVADVPIASSTRFEEHAFTYGRIETHAALSLEAVLEAPLRWITVARLGEDLVPDGEGVAWEGGRADLDGGLELGGERYELTDP